VLAGSTEGRVSVSNPRFLFGLCVLVAIGVWVVPASADPSGGPPICPGTETAVVGSYHNLTITGNMYVADGTSLNVSGNLIVAPGACFDAFTLGTVTVGQNVLVGRGAIFALGCTPGSLGPPFPQAPCGFTTTSDVVGGSIVAAGALTMYLDGNTIWGDVISLGGGPGPTLNPYINFPIKDNTIHGNVIVSGWKGAWFGFIRNVTGGNVTLTGNVGVTIGDLGTPDSTEVVSNTISGNLICLGNSPAAQIGDSGGTINTVGRYKIGECRAV
jgi:hypothetical protein